MKKVFFFFLAFFAVNFIFSQKAEEILNELPEIDQIMIDRYYRQKFPPCPQKPVVKKPSSGHFIPKSAPTAPMPSAPIVNIIGNNQYEKIEIINDRNGFRLNLEKAKPICCPDKIIWTPIVKGDSVILFPGAEPVALPHVLPDPNGNYFNSAPGSGNSGVGGKSGYGFGGEGPAFLFGLLIAGACMALYFLSKRNTSPASQTSPAPVSPSAPTPKVEEVKVESDPVVPEQKNEEGEFKSRSREGYRERGNQSGESPEQKQE